MTNVMFEYWFHGLNDGDGSFTHHGTTHDFLEVCCQIAQCYDSRVAGDLVNVMLTKHDKELSFLRVTEFELEYHWSEIRDDGFIIQGTRVPVEKKIVLHKHR